MAYKFQLGPARMSGSLMQEGTLNVIGGIQVSGTMRVGKDGEGSFVALAATGLASLDGGIDVNGAATISTAGAIAGATSIDGSGDLTMGTITMSGFTVDADGDTAHKTQAVDDSSTIGCDSDVDLLTLAAQSITVAADSAITYKGTAVTSTGAELNLVDGSSAGTIVNSKAVIYGSSGEVNGTTLQIAGASITSTAAELNYLDNDDLSAARIAYLAGVTAGTALASKAVVLDANKDATGIRSLTGSGNFRAGGIYSDGALYAAGNAQFDGSMALGNATADNLQFNGSVASNFVPDADSSRNLGSDALRFATIYVDSIVGASVAWDVVVCDGGNTISASAELALVRQGNGVTVTLPAATVGRNIRVKLSGGVGDVLLAPATNELIEGQGNPIRLEATGSAVTLCGVQGGGWSIL